MFVARARSASRMLAVAAVTGGLVTAAVPHAVAVNGTSFAVHRIVADRKGKAKTVDKNLVNPWGLSQGPQTPVWVSDNGTGVSTIYSATAATPKVPLTVTVPKGDPSGQVYNSTSGFAMGGGGTATFIFDSEAGVISAWSSGTAAKTEVTVKKAVFKGLAITDVNSTPMLFATDFHHGVVDAFDGNWSKVSTTGGFEDPNLPSGYAPFGIQAFGSDLYITYAKQDSHRHDDVAAPGAGIIDVFTTDGVLVKRLVSHGKLNSPWGLAMAPAGFGAFGGDLLEANFGNGRINAYDPGTGQYVGTLHNGKGKPIVLHGLWGLLFGNGTSAAPDDLMFTAGPGGEAHGLFGYLTAKN